MLAPLKWLKEYVDINVSPKELADKMTMSGTKVEQIEEIGKEINNVVVGKILEINPHPQADRLVVTKVDIGENIIQIVTGANNISENDYIPVALVGSTLPGNIKIKKSKLRGIESQGMMCSAGELGMNLEGLPEEQISGIYIFHKEYPLGMDVKEILGLDEVLVEFELTNNRPDCLSIIGLAREVAATLKQPLVMPFMDIKNEVEHIQDYATIEVKAPHLCHRYMGRIVKDIKIAPSPKWMQDKLLKMGVRPINNIVDVTNYVMLETGQPLHAFDCNKLGDNKIIVRTARDGEKMITLDDVERELDSSTLVIADANKPIAIAGVMGGENTEVDENTKTILLESANFDAISVRKTAKKLGLRTEASNRYEKGLDPNLVELAMNRALQLLEDIHAGVVVGGSEDIYPNPVLPHHIDVDPQWINKFIGIDSSSEEMAEYLERLDMEVEIDEVLKIQVPTFRQDIVLPVDVAEEVARLYGYDKIPPTSMSGIAVEGKRTPLQKLEDKTKDLLIGLGGYEIVTYSFGTPKNLDQLKIAEDDEKRQALMLINPLGEENSMMRTTLMGNMLQVVAHNIHRNVDKATFFELASTYHPRELPIVNLPLEVQKLCIGMYGEVDFFDLKGRVENLLDMCGIVGYEFKGVKIPTFHPGRAAEVIFKGEVLGVLGEIHPRVAENFDINERIYIGEFNFDALYKNSNLKRHFKDLPKYPSVTRDIALLVEEDIPAREIEKIIEKYGNSLMESYELFDVYQGKQIPEKHKSLAYSIIYRRQDRTLTDEEVNKVHNRIVQELRNKLDAQLRE